MHLPRLLAAGLTVTIGIAGCGGGGNSASGQQTVPAPAAGSSHAPARPAPGQPTCARAPASMVNAALGTDLGSPQQTLNNDQTVCRFQGPQAGEVIVQFQIGEDTNTFAAGRMQFDNNNLGDPTSNYPHFADEAYYETLGIGALATNTLVARRGSIEILVSSQASLRAEQKLEQQLFTKF